MTVADASADEGDSITFTATLDKAVPDGFTVTPSFTDASATKGADYTENTAVITFAGTQAKRRPSRWPPPRTPTGSPTRRSRSA